MKRIITILVAAVALLGISSSCSDLNRIQDDLSALENRVDVLEKLLPVLNGNIEAVRKLVDAGTVNSVELKDGIYTVTLSNGEKLTLTQGSIGVGKTPLMSVDKEGYWMVDYQDGKGAVPVLADNKKVKASGKDGVTPVFGVDKDGFWTISYDGGKTTAQVKDEAGKPVPAVAEGGAADPFFKDVKYEGTKLTVVLSNGESLQLPVVSGFLCAIRGAEGLQVFKAGESKVYTVEMKGVASTVVTAPQGWTAALATDKLTVTAPAATKAELADSRKDVAVLAVSEQGLSTITKLQVSIGDAPVVPAPVATVTAGQATENSLAFTVTAADVTGWKYLLKKSGETAPSVEELMTSGKDGTTDALSFTGLEASTEYVLYVLPFHKEIKGEIASAKLATAAPQIGNDLYQAYQKGLEITVAGRKLSKAVNGEAVLVTAEAPLTELKPEIAAKSAVVFLETSGSNSFTLGSYTNIDGDVALIGRYADKKAVLAPKFAMKIMEGTLALKNLVIDQSSFDAGNKYFIYNSKNTEKQPAVFGGLYFEDCDFVEIAKPIVYMSEASCAIKDIVVSNCTFEIGNKAQAKYQLFNIYKNTKLHEFKKIVFDNNLIYCKSGVKWLQLFSYAQDVKQEGTVWDLDASICNNTIYNLPGGNGYFKFYQVKTMKMNRNIFYAEADYSDGASANVIYYSAAQTGDGIDLSGNIAYGLAEGKNWVIAHGNSTYKPADNFVEKLAATPFQTADPAAGKFQPKAEYASYGVQSVN